MRRPRFKTPETPTLYHCVSRVVEKLQHFGDPEKEHLTFLLREYEAFCGVTILGYCMMSNHFHVLVEVPPRPEILPTAEELIQRLEQLTASGVSAAAVRQRVAMYRALNDVEGEENFLESFFRRMWDVSAFMKLIKQRFSAWFNRRKDREGTLWSERFQSTLVEAGEAVGMVSCYVDLNPIRAGMVTEPESYRWSGYAEAMAGGKLAQQGIQRVMELFLGQVENVATSVAEYRRWLYVRGEERAGSDENGRPLRLGFSRERVLAVLRDGGQVSKSEYLRCRVRYFTAGVALGSREYVEGIFQRFRQHFGRRRRQGAHPLPGWAEPTLYSLQKFRPDAVT